MGKSLPVGIVRNAPPPSIGLWAYSHAMTLVPRFLRQAIGVCCCRRCRSGSSKLRADFSAVFFRRVQFRVHLAKNAKKERTRIAASPFQFGSSGGRIRTSDLRVMSGFRSHPVSVCWRDIYGNRKGLHPCAALVHLPHFDHVFQRNVYRFVYIEGTRVG